MATARSFEELEVWKSARRLAKNIYSATQSGPFSKDFVLRDQLRRAAVSIVSNIAEGFERSGKSEFIRFLHITKGSAGEVRAQIYLALDLSYLSEAAFSALNGDIIRISRQLAALIMYLEGAPARKSTAGNRMKSAAGSQPSTLNL